MSRIVAGIQARMGSTRLSGKALMPIADQPLVHWVIERVKSARKLDQVWLLTTTNSEDDVLAEAMAKTVNILRGDPQDVASRYQTLFEKTDATHVLRITGDCPLVDAALIDALIELAQTTQADYAHILAQAYYNPSYPNGFNAELFSYAAFQTMLRLNTPADCEHVTAAVDRYPEQFTIARLTPPVELSRPQWKLSVDTAEDLARIRSIVAALEQISGQGTQQHKACQSTVQQIIAVLDAHPEWQV